MNSPQQEGIRYNADHVDKIVTYALSLNGLTNDGKPNIGKDILERLEATMAELADASITMTASVHTVHLQQPGYDPQAFLTSFLSAFYTNLMHTFQRASELHSQGEAPIKAEFEEGGSDVE